MSDSFAGSICTSRSPQSQEKKDNNCLVQPAHRNLKGVYHFVISQAVFSQGDPLIYIHGRSDMLLVRIPAEF